jgi:predicted alpha/beta-hydrolase family hydrolase
VTRRLVIEWEPGRKVEALLSGPGSGQVGVLLAHGAGAGQRHDFMAGMRRRLGAAGLPALSFDYPYIAEGRKAPDRLERLLTCHLAAYRRLAERTGRVVLVGKSMGGRVGGHLAPEVAVDGVVFLGYPLIPLGKSEPRDTSHLGRVGAPLLFVQGERDRMGPPEAIAPIALDLGARLEVIAEASHGFAVPKSSGLTRDDVLDRLADLVEEFTRER